MKIHLKDINFCNISSHVIVCGSPERIRWMAEMLTNCEMVSQTRGYYVYSGYYKGEYLTLCAVGIGGPSIAIALEELIDAGARAIIRLGSCGVLSSECRPGDIFISLGAVRHDGTSVKYLPLEYPTIPDHQLTEQLIKTAHNNDVPVKVALGSCNDVYYKHHRTTADNELRELKKKTNVLFGEMECATLFAVGIIRAVRTAAILVSDSSVDVKADMNKICDFDTSMYKAAKVALDTLVEDMKFLGRE